VTTTRNGFTNSEGCSEKAPSTSQRLAPLTSVPSTRVAASKATATTSPITAKRRIEVDDSIETASIRATAGPRYKS
jgi:hypothetical protein